MKEDFATGPGLPNPAYPDLAQRLATTTALPDDDIRFVLAVCSAYAYGDANTMATVMDRLGLTRNRCRMISEYVDALFLTSTAYLIQSQDGRVAILCYRGTPPTSVITWLTDFQVEPVKIPVSTPSGKGFGSVHAGFYRNVRSTRFRIVELLQLAIAGRSVLDQAEILDDGRLECGLEALFVTGHSLGGASAALLAALLVAEPSKYEEILKRLRAVYTFGANMIGDRAFADACNDEVFLRDKVIRYVYGNDVVPQLPPKASGSFKHFGREYRYAPAGEHGGWRHTRPREQLRSVVQLAGAPLAIPAKMFRLTRHIPFHASLSDHLPQYYIDALTPDALRSEFGD